MYAAGELARCGYCYVPGPSGNPSDWVLRQKEDEQKGFEWRGQEDYDALGDAVVAYVQAQLCGLCGLVPLPLPPGGASGDAGAHGVVYASPALEEQTAPLLLLVCGSAPGGAAGVWGRSLCINGSLLEGAMFDYVFRARREGWSVLVANPNVSDVVGVPIPGSESPHLHMHTLWKAYVEPARASCVLAVAHSYGAPAMTHLLKADRGARERMRALGLTDGSAYEPGTLLREVVPTEGAPEPGSREAAVREKLRRFQELTPAAFAPPDSAEVADLLAAVGRNFVASQQPLGTPIAADKEGVPALSSGHESHPATTHAATSEVFAFLRAGAEGRAAAANDELRARCASAEEAVSDAPIAG